MGNPVVIGNATLYLGDCLEVMPTLDANSVDAIVTDPPYGLGFMGKAWDHAVPGVPFWLEMLRVAKPGSFLVAFGGTRTFHRMACAIEDAGWELRDTLMWVYGSGFPKSLSVSKAIDKAAGEARQIDGRHAAVSRAVGIAGNDGRCLTCGRGRGGQPGNCRCDKSGDPVTDAARQWEGWGTALKPAWEPIILARKPLNGTVAANVLAHGTGALNIDGCRIDGAPPSVPQPDLKAARKAITGFDSATRNGEMSQATGRWPANLIHDGSEEVLAGFPDRMGFSGGGATPGEVRNDVYGKGWQRNPSPDVYADTGSAARFFYCAKADRTDRNDGCDGMPESVVSVWGGDEDDLTAGKKSTVPRANNHPTVKPTDLMRWLCRLVTPPGGLILDPFTGSGSTGRGAILGGFRFTGIELDPDYTVIAEARIAAAVEQRRIDTAQLQMFGEAA